MAADVAGAAVTRMVLSDVLMREVRLNRQRQSLRRSPHRNIFACDNAHLSPVRRPSCRTPRGPGAGLDRRQSRPDIAPTAARGGCRARRSLTARLDPVPPSGAPPPQSFGDDIGPARARAFVARAPITRRSKTSAHHDRPQAGLALGAKDPPRAATGVAARRPPDRQKNENSQATALRVKRSPKAMPRRLAEHTAVGEAKGNNQAAVRCTRSIVTGAWPPMISNRT